MRKRVDPYGVRVLPIAATSATRRQCRACAPDVRRVVTHYVAAREVVLAFMCEFHAHQHARRVRDRHRQLAREAGRG